MKLVRIVRPEMNVWIGDTILPRGRGFDPFKRNSFCIGCEEDQEYLAELRAEEDEAMHREHLDDEALLDELEAE